MTRRSRLRARIRRSDQRLIRQSRNRGGRRLAARLRRVLGGKDQP